MQIVINKLMQVQNQRERKSRRKLKVFISNDNSSFACLEIGQSWFFFVFGFFGQCKVPVPFVSESVVA